MELKYEESRSRWPRRAAHHVHGVGIRYQVSGYGARGRASHNRARGLG